MPTEITEGGQANLDSLLHPAGDPADTFAPDFVDHDPAAGQPEGGEGLAWYWERFAESFSDVQRDLLDTVATAEHVVTVMDLSGTHTGEWLGHAPTGKRFTVRNVQVMRIVDGKRVERWGSTDELGILQQLGLA
jgi:predicted ester cyclase